MENLVQELWRLVDTFGIDVVMDTLEMISHEIDGDIQPETDDA